MRTSSPRIALEAIKIKTRFTMSMEEEMLIADQANTDASEIREAVAESTRTLEVSDALNDLAETAGRITEATSTELELVERAAQVAVAGTDRDPSALVPAIEQYLGKPIAMEDFKETAKKMFEFIMGILKKIRDKIMSFFKSAVVIPAQIQRLEAVESKLKEANEEAVVASSIKMLENRATKETPANKALAINGVVNLRPQAIFDGLVGLDEALKESFERGLVLASRRIGEVIQAMKQFDFKSERRYTTVPLYESFIKEPSIAMKGGKTSEEDGYEVVTSPPLIGNFAIVSRKWKGSADVSPEDALAGLERIRKGGLKVEDMGSEAKVIKDAKGYSMRDVEQLSSGAKDLLNALQSNAKSGEEQVQEITKKFEEAAADLTKRYEAEGPHDVVTEQHYKALMGFGVSVAAWLEEPMIPVFQRSINTVRAVIVLLNEVAEGVHGQQDLPEGES